MRGPPLLIGSDNGLRVYDVIDEFDLEAGAIEDATATFAILDDYRDHGGSVITSGTLTWNAAAEEYQGTIEDGAAFEPNTDYVEEITIDAGDDRLRRRETQRRAQRDAAN